MSEWWTYTLTDFLLFSPRTYYRLFELYNLAIWPVQIVALGFGLAIVASLLKTSAWHGRAIAATLVVCWLWIAWAYLILQYDTINWAARYFAVGFVVQALLLFWAGVVRNQLVPRRSADVIKIAGLGIFLFALFVQPLIGPLVGRPWTQAEVFGIAPDPTVVATLGILTTAIRPLWVLLAMPLLWCMISAATLWAMESWEALVMLAMAALAIVLAACKTLSRPA